MTIKPCKICGTQFEKQSMRQAVCSPLCAVKYPEYQRKAKAEKAARASHKAKKQALRTKSDWLKLTQEQFNRFIRLRDADLPCISCGRHHTGQYHAGHYRTTAAQPALRFNEIGCHKQCMPCNLHKSGNISEYRIGLINKIGIQLVEWLEQDHPKHKAWSIPEIQAIGQYYREQIKLMEAGSHDLVSYQ